jgi:hypothetical protein
MAKGDQGSLVPRVVTISVCACAIAYVDSIVDIYLRKMLPLSEWQSHVKDIPSLVSFLSGHGVFWTEQTRQISFFVLLIAIALLSGSSTRQKLGFFLWGLSVSELFHYISMYLLIKWPRSLGTWDVIALFPQPWVAPVYVPVIISLAMIMCAIFLMREDDKGSAKPSRPKPASKSASKSKKKESSD